MIELDVSVYAKVYPYDNGLVIVDQKELIWFDKNGKEDGRVELQDMICRHIVQATLLLYGDAESAQVYNEEGVLILEKLMQVMSADGEILFGRQVKTTSCCQLSKKDSIKQEYSTMKQKDVDEMLFPYQSMMDLGFLVILVSSCGYCY